MKNYTHLHQEVELWPEPVDGAALLEEIAFVLRRKVVLPLWGPETLALWDLHTYAFDLRNVTTYIGIESPEKQCGKTTLLTVLSQLVNRPELAANISPPAFFRVIEENSPTLLIDEADTFLKRNGELRGILNAGYTRETAYVVRVANEEPKNELVLPTARGSRLMRFSCFCPKALASIGRLPDTLADRCITIRMHRKIAAEGCDRSRNLDATILRRKCARFVADHAEEIAKARPAIEARLADRTVDIWEPLLVLADLAGGSWPEKAREAMAALTASAQENNPIGSLLFDIFRIFTLSGQDRLFSRTLAAALDEIFGRPWSELRRGKEVSESWLAKTLRVYGIRPKTIWIGGLAAKGYLEEEFLEIFLRYIPQTELDALRDELMPPAPNAEKSKETEVAPEKDHAPENGDRPPEAREKPEDGAAAA